MNNCQTTQYNLMFQNEQISIRKYHKHMVARLSFSAPREVALRRGYNTLAAYFYGHNIPRNNTSNNVHKIGDELTFSPPMMVTRTSQGHLVDFPIAGEYSQDNLPEPKNKDIKIVEIPDVTLAVVKFSGDWEEENFDKHKHQLLEELRFHSVDVHGPMVEAYYDRSHILPSRRRNEVLVPIQNNTAIKIHGAKRESLKLA